MRAPAGSFLASATAAGLLLVVSACGAPYRAPDRGGPVPRVAPGDTDARPGRAADRGTDVAPLTRNGDPAAGIAGMMGPGAAAIQIGNTVLVAWPESGPPVPPGASAAPPPAAGTPYTGAPSGGTLMTPRGDIFTPNDLDNRIRAEYPSIRYVHLASDAATAAEVRRLAGELRGGVPAADLGPRLLDLLRRTPSISRPADGRPSASPQGGGAPGAGARAP